jgi:prepilin-type N-terminal cleavage/methylation domain-containing protein
MEAVLKKMPPLKTNGGVHMKQKHGFTLVELLVVISIIALLLSILMPSLNKARGQAQKIVCGSNLKQFGTICEMYLVDNSRKFIATTDNTSYGYTPPGTTLPREVNNWLHLLLPYYTDFKILHCPSTRPQKFGNVNEYNNNLTADKTQMCTIENIYERSTGKKKNEASVSYGVNNFMLLPIETNGSINRSKLPLNWGGHDSVTSKRDQVPVFADCTVRAGVCYWYDKPPAFKGQDDTNVGNGNGLNCMRRFALVRHFTGVNVLFADSSVKHTGIKTMWKLNWHKNYQLFREPTWPDWMRKYQK